MVRADLGPNVQTDEFAAVAFTDAQHGFVGGNGGRIFATSDGGHHWATQRKDTTETFQAMAFSTPKRGLAGGFTDFSNERKASLVATVDGGETWVARLMPGAIVWDVAFATPTTAFAVGCAEWYPPPAQLPCQRSLIAKVTFPGGEGSGSGGASGGSGSGGGGGGGSSVPFVLVGAAIVFFVAGAVVLLRGRRGARH
ncbi:MAG: WD40/YVTN/BNR-like repeat-containing protein, partial [Acidimicrobiales bacterium]